MTGPTVRGQRGLSRRRTRLVGLAVAVLLALTSCGAPVAGVPSTEVLADLMVIARPVTDGTYRRAAFGPSWTDTDGNGCNQRDDALQRFVDRALPHLVGVQGSCDHDALSGTWNDPYTGQQLTFVDLKDPVQARAIPIDHRVALGSAWRYGAAAWDDQRRLAFANDLDNLQPVSERSNQSKGDRDAADWRPPKAAQCDYATRYVATKSRYGLAVDQSEKSALTQMLRTC